MQFIDSLTAARGWVSKTAVGDANMTVWLVVQHYGADKWKAYLPLFRQAAEDGEMSKWQVAMLEDRILVNEGKPQKYGSQTFYKEEDGRNRFEELQDTAMVDIYRAEVGMEPIAEYAKRMNIVWNEQ